MAKKLKNQMLIKMLTNKNLDDKIIYHMKLSEINMLESHYSRLFRISGNIDQTRKRNNNNSNSQLVLFSEEENLLKNENDLQLSFLEENFKFNFGYAKRRHQVLVDLSFLNDFNWNDINLQHDLIQFIGYKKQNSYG